MSPREEDPDVGRRKADRDPSHYRRLRYRQRRDRARLERERFDPAPVTDEDWSVPDRDGLRRVPNAPESLGSLIDAVAGQQGWGDRLQGLRLFDAWEEVVGAELAQHCSPVRLSGGVLLVAVTDPAWATQLRYLSSRLQVRANQLLGRPVVEEVQVVVRRSL